jgi:hypothetical protein
MNACRAPPKSPLGVGEHAPDSRLKVRGALRPHAGRIEPLHYLDGEMSDVYRLGRILTQISTSGLEQSVIETPSLESRIVLDPESPLVRAKGLQEGSLRPALQLFHRKTPLLSAANSRARSKISS